MMVVRKMRLGLLAAGAVVIAAGLGGCADDYYGGGVATGYFDGPVGYGADYYGGLGYPGYGVYNDFYYPGSGIYVFDRFGHRRAWNDDERRHWEYHGNNFRGNHLMENGRFDARRDHAYMADRNAGFRSFRHGGAAGGGRPGGGARPGGGRPGGDGRHP